MASEPHRLQRDLPPKHGASRAQGVGAEMTLHVGLHQIVQGRKLGFSPTRLHQEARPRGIGDILLVNLEVKARSPQYRPTRHLAQGRQLPHQPQRTGARSIFVGGDRGDRGHNSQLNRPTQNPNSKIPNPKSQMAYSPARSSNATHSLRLPPAPL